MIALEDFKKSLGEKINTLSEEEIIELRELQDKIADAVFDFWIRKRNNITDDE